MIKRRVKLICFCAFFLGRLTGSARADGTVNISSPAFAEGQPIPARCALANDNLCPDLRLKGVPPNARSLVLIVDDPDAPAGLWTHWLVWNLPPDTTRISAGNLPPEARVGKNSFGRVRYDGPAPPSGTHRYYFHIYALDATLSLPSGSDRAALLQAMGSDHLVAKGETFGTYRASP